nr:nucleotidyl transferase AbiEii/AbiGii toxin family protein [Streptomyces sp. GbtcB6]
MVEYVLERFVYRLASSPLGREHFVLKGGLLLAQFGARRMTRDIDILGRHHRPRRAPPDLLPRLAPPTRHRLGDVAQRELVPLSEPPHAQQGCALTQPTRLASAPSEYSCRLRSLQCRGRGRAGR